MNKLYTPSLLVFNIRNAVGMKKNWSLIMAKSDQNCLSKVNICTKK